MYYWGGFSNGGSVIGIAFGHAVEGVAFELLQISQPSGLGFGPVLNCSVSLALEDRNYLGNALVLYRTLESFFVRL